MPSADVSGGGAPDSCREQQPARLSTAAITRGIHHQEDRIAAIAAMPSATISGAAGAVLRRVG